MAEALMSLYDGAEGGAAAKWRALMVAIGSLVASCGELSTQLSGRLSEVRSAWDSRDISERFNNDVKRECWSFLQEKYGNSYTILDREDRVIRAMLCLLESPGNRQAASDMAGWVEEMLGQYCGGELK